VDELGERDGQSFARRRGKVLQDLDRSAGIFALGLDGEPVWPVKQNETALRAGVLEHNPHQDGKQL
jgi:hypothetical protein